MNIWTEKSIKIANSAGYLDKLHDIYVMNINAKRSLRPDFEKAIREAFNKKDTILLVGLLLTAPVYPIKDSYVGSLRANKKAIHENPLTIKRIGERLYQLGIDQVLTEAGRPKETNRQLGGSFRAWLPKLGYPMLDENQFKSTKGSGFLIGSDKALKKFANDNLGFTLNKGVDLLFKKNGLYVIGEAKFLTTPGGEQNGGFADASTFINAPSKSAKKIAVIDGYVWFKTNAGLHSKIINSNLDIFSALVLKDYLAAL